MWLSSNAVYAVKRTRIGIDILYSGSSLDKAREEMQVNMREEDLIPLAQYSNCCLCTNWLLGTVQISRLPFDLCNPIK